MSRRTSFTTGYDELVWEAEEYLKERVDSYSWIPRNALVRMLARQFRLGWDTADRILDELHKHRILEADYGRFRISRQSSVQSG